MNQREAFSIRQMVELTGLTEFTIRGWENRYAAFVPNRSETGRRLYSKKDIERALLLRELLKRGYKIGEIARLGNQKLLNLFETVESSPKVAGDAGSSADVTKALEFMALQKWPELENLMRQLQRKRPIELIDGFFLPLIAAMARRQEAGFISISQEHILTSFLKEKIYAALSALPASQKPKPSTDKLRFVLATPEGDYHELGLLLAHLLIRSFGYTSLYLGPHTPAQDLAETTLRFEATHLLIVSTVSKNGGARQELLTYLSEIQKRARPPLKILIAGGQARLITTHSPDAFFSFSDFHSLENYLHQLGGSR